MLALPADTAFTNPVLDTVATPTAFEAQVEAVAEPVNWLVLPIHKDALPVTIGRALIVTCKLAVQLFTSV